MYKNCHLMGYDRQTNQEYLFVKTLILEEKTNTFYGDYIQIPPNEVQSVNINISDVLIEMFLIKTQGVQVYDSLTGTHLTGGDTSIEALKRVLKQILGLEHGVSTYHAKQQKHIEDWGVSPAYGRTAK